MCTEKIRLRTSTLRHSLQRKALRQFTILKRLRRRDTVLMTRYGRKLPWRIILLSQMPKESRQAKKDGLLILYSMTRYPNISAKLCTISTRLAIAWPNSEFVWLTETERKNLLKVWNFILKALPKLMIMTTAERWHIPTVMQQEMLQEKHLMT